MTPRELALIGRALTGSGAAPPGRDVLADLMQRFPDAGPTSEVDQKFVE